MADIALAVAGSLHVVESLEQATLPLGEAVDIGQMVRLDTAGKFTKSNGTTAGEAAVYGMVVSKDPAGIVATALRRGMVDGFTLAGAYGSKVYLSDTDGGIADGTGTVTKIVGEVFSATATTLGTAYDKILRLDCAGG